MFFERLHSFPDSTQTQQHQGGGDGAAEALHAHHTDMCKGLGTCRKVVKTSICGKCRCFVSISDQSLNTCIKTYLFSSEESFCYELTCFHQSLQISIACLSDHNECWGWAGFLLQSPIGVTSPSGCCTRRRRFLLCWIIVNHNESQWAEKERLLPD